MSATRAEASGDMAIIRGKLAGKYDSVEEREVIGWFKALINEEIVPGMRELEKQFKDGLLLVRLAQHVQQNTPNIPEKARKMRLKPHVNAATSYKQMENIQMFLKFCDAYGVPKGAQFQTVDLYEGRNLAQVLNCIQMLGSECQRHGFNGPTIGPKPLQAQAREFSQEVLRAGDTIIGLQAGTNKLASQKGMQIGAVRHVADIRADNMVKEGQGELSLQAGTNKFATQAGMSMGSVRHVSDIRADDMNKDSQAFLTLQAGTNKYANQSGMRIGGLRHAPDIKADNQCKDSQTILTLQGGHNKGASQKGMTIGGVRHAADIRADDMTKESQGLVSLQAGSNKYATQAGMSLGAVRHVADIRADDLTREGQGVIGLQMGTNTCANQSGMSIGALRHIASIRADQFDQAGQGVIGHWMKGQAGGATQEGMSMGSKRDIVLNHKKR